MSNQVLSGIIFSFFGLIVSCSSPVEDRLTGEWRLDSAYYFYNNFHYSREGWHQEEIYEFMPEGVVYTKAVNSSVANRYNVMGCELIFQDEKGVPFNTYEILELSDSQLALKNEKAPLFKGPHQKRYEIRYFSRVNTEKP